MADTVKSRATKYARAKVFNAYVKANAGVYPNNEQIAVMNKAAKPTPSLLALARINLARESLRKAKHKAKAEAIVKAMKIKGDKPMGTAH